MHLPQHINYVIVSRHRQPISSAGRLSPSLAEVAASATFARPAAGEGVLADGLAPLGREFEVARGELPLPHIYHLIFPYLSIYSTYLSNLSI